jgi:hypothetical protein
MRGVMARTDVLTGAASGRGRATTVLLERRRVVVDGGHDVLARDEATW